MSDTTRPDARQIAEAQRDADRPNRRVRHAMEVLRIANEHLRTTLNEAVNAVAALNTLDGAEMSETINATCTFCGCSTPPGFRNHMFAVECRDARGERITALESERDALQQQLATLTAPPVRKLRQYKGVTYDVVTHPVFPWRYLGIGYTSVTVLMGRHLDDFADADHAPILALEDDPFEKQETLEEVLHEFTCRSSDGLYDSPRELVNEIATRVRAIVRGETSV